MNRPKCKPIRSRRAFTLVEMLVVITVISILMGIGASTMKKMTTAQGVESAVPVAESLFAEARAMAKSQGVHTRVVIYAGDRSGKSAEKYLRYMGIVTQSRNGTDSVTWNTPGRGVVLKSRGISLPSKTFFNATLSGLTDADKGEFDVTFPGNTTPQPCFYYEFNAEGILVHPNFAGGATDQPNGIFVVQNGVLPPGKDLPKVLPSNKKDVGGFAIWKRGNTTMFRSPSQIPTVVGGDPEF